MVMEINTIKYGLIIKMRVSHWRRAALCLQGSSPSHLQTLVCHHLYALFIPDSDKTSPETDRDGTIDMVFTTCASVDSSTGVGGDCAINIAYNKQLQLCTSSTDSGIRKGQRTCRPPEQLCIADPTFSFDFTISKDNDVSFLAVSYATECLAIG